MLGRRKQGSLFHQLTKKLNSLNRFGQSKHQAKQEYRKQCEARGIKWNPAAAPGIYSIKTMQAYKQTSQEFSHWIKQNYPDIKNVKQIERKHTIAYLQSRQNQGKSAWTVSKDMSALNKVFNLGLTKKEVGLHARSYKNTTRSRVDRQHDHKYNPKNYEKQIAFSRAFGVRRESVNGGQYQVKDVSLFRHNGQVYASLIEKGGRYREAPCLRSMQPQIEKMYPHIQERELTPIKQLQSTGKTNFKQLYSHSQNYLFDKYTTKIDNHAFRHEYAKQLTKELSSSLNRPEDRSYRGYDKDVLQAVSEALGHSRLSVVVEYYLH